MVVRSESISNVNSLVASSRPRTIAVGAVHLAADLNMQTLVLIVSKNNAPMWNPETGRAPTLAPHQQSILNLFLPILLIIIIAKSTLIRPNHC